MQSKDGVPTEGLAAYCRSHEGPSGIRLETFNVPSKVPKGQLLVEVKACGVNFPDLLVTQGKYQLKPRFPFAPGGEISGVVVACPEGSRRKVGDEVIALTGYGGFSSHVLVAEAQAFSKPSQIPFPQAAALLMTYGTCLYALETRADVRPGEWVLVTGAAGGIGTAAIELCRAMGARVIAVASSEGKRALCLKLGAEHAISYDQLTKGEAKTLTGGKGLDVVLDSVGSAFAEKALRQMAWNGRFLVIGFAGGDIPKIALNLPLLKNCSIVGVFWGAWLQREPKEAGAHVMKLSKWFEEGKIRPLVTKTYSLEESKQALVDFQTRKMQGKIIVTPAKAQPFAKL
uniref:Enoyl reductase (ER) domain-containing protein n=1 Tax=Chromera velia CCMP2878 TaxID=1169474 RepID=A0A0G4HGY3_9ALVE|mmetsp:Transcript_24517/g.48073  ORF Transcript_24517/g.48073 Transcript_24517/m.48073 type:complete len:343 (+) Transcript_24517:204-1232(+)|eukprot:Cvel_27442.t1-p1 / transcript=Cvel_27442.t1 / gene=Cvel_27442 / organism=Chromera_velia_CCMP2878 / gene_product=Quinone oxidoreductase-like protein 2, putative / transcript_product=Quinone oxidoreductase-like protein 2, putative / location=Cvel_scaffold3424:11472-13798(+) / protein_length=342 / sequence_SO=supercontig / SO=protein_coding / is_pseudo=false